MTHDERLRLIYRPFPILTHDRTARWGGCNTGLDGSIVQRGKRMNVGGFDRLSEDQQEIAMLLGVLDDDGVADTLPRCEACGEEIEDAQRSTRRVCDDACRKRLARLKQRMSA